MEDKRYLKIFSSQSDYESQKDFVMGIPHVVLFEDTKKIVYKPYPKLEKGFYTLKHNDMYLSDNTVSSSDNTRVLTSGDINNKNIFYNTEDNALISYSSGFGFVNGILKTSNPDDGYNTFKYRVGSEIGTFTIMCQQGTTISDLELNNGRYLKNNNGALDFDVNVNNASNWTIEPINEIPITMNFGNDTEGALSTIWTPVALQVPEGIVAYGIKSNEDSTLNLIPFKDNIIPANTGALIQDKNAKQSYIAKLIVTTEKGCKINDNELVGSFLTVKNDNSSEYYSLGIKDGIVNFYKYTGSNLSGFKARLRKLD